MHETGDETFDAAFRSRMTDLLRWRRDVRRFDPTPLPPGAFERLAALAALAPSVGLSEPWRFVLVESCAARRAVALSFARCNAAALAAQADDRAGLYARLKLAGLDEAPCQFALFTDHETAQGHGLGRRTMPETLDYSAVMALHTLWLAARAEGIGLGWVSILSPRDVSDALDVPESWKLIGYFCLGYPRRSSQTPELETCGWEQRRGEPAILRR